MIRNTILEHFFFDDSRLKIGAIQDSNIFSACAAVHSLYYFVGNKFSFDTIIVGFKNRNGITFGIVSEQVLVYALGIFFDDGVGGLDDGFRRAIVFFKLDNDGIRIILFKVQDVNNIRTTPRINILVTVANYANIPRAFGQKSRQQILHFVRVLVLVDMYVAKTFVILFQNLGVTLEQLDRLEQEIVEIKRFLSRLFLFVFFPDR